ncbi:MAG TPA: hypothetical protein VGN52_06310 [Burkholderiales bacterium]
MSLWRPEAVRIGLAPGRATLLRAAGRKHTVAAAQAVPLDLDTGEPGLQALAAELAKPEYKGRHVDVVLSDALVRYFVVRAPAGLRHRTELLEAIAARFEEQFGLPAADWVLCPDLEPGGSAYLTCAMPRRLLEEIRRACAPVRLRSLRPFAISELNGFRRRLPRQGFWFAAVEGDSVTLACRGKREWLWARSQVVRQDFRDAVATIAAREALREGLPEPVAIQCAGAVGHPVELAAPAPLALLGNGLWAGTSPEWSGTYRLALSGLWQ